MRLLIVDDEPHIIDGVSRIINWSDYNIKDIRAPTRFKRP